MYDKIDTHKSRPKNLGTIDRIYKMIHDYRHIDRDLVIVLTLRMLSVNGILSYP